MGEVTIKDIAKICGVGVSTVSRAINSHPDINPDTKKMVMETIKKYDYVPNNSARNLKRTEANTIAVLVKGMTNPFFNTMIKVIEKYIKKRKYSMVLHHVEFNEDEVDVAIELIKEKRLRGIIFLGGYFIHNEEKMAKIQVPFILSTVGCHPENISRQKYSSIAVDDEKESYRLTEYLIQSGHREIVILAADTEDASIGKLRLQGYINALKDYQIPYRDELVRHMRSDIEAYSMENGYLVTKELLESGIHFTAIFAISDVIAIGACKAIIDFGKSVPSHYSVAGFDGIELGSYYNPSITTIKQPVEEMATQTVKLLFSIIEDHKGHEHRIFPGELLVRESTRIITEQEIGD